MQRVGHMAPQERRKPWVQGVALLEECKERKSVFRWMSDQERREFQPSWIGEIEASVIWNSARTDLYCVALRKLCRITCPIYFPWSLSQPHHHPHPIFGIWGFVLHVINSLGLSLHVFPFLCTFLFLMGKRPWSLAF